LKPKLVLVAAAALWLAACSGFAEYTECRDGDVQSCSTACGPGTQTCTDGAWSTCQLDATPACQPGESGTCTLTPDEPPGMWFCSDTCEVGPCVPICTPGTTTECTANCGPGQTTCQDDGTWGECVEYVVPTCRPNEVSICNGPDGAGYWRCTDECEWGPCDASLACYPGEVAACGVCASQECDGEGSWGTCTPRAGAACSPGESQECPAPCGAGFQICGSNCQWSDCIGFGGCTPGQRQVCPGSYCGVAYRFCGPDCTWTECIEAGY
jgi:hypothetical protein